MNCVSRVRSKAGQDAEERPDDTLRLNLQQNRPDWLTKGTLDIHFYEKFPYALVQNMKGLKIADFVSLYICGVDLFWTT